MSGVQQELRHGHVLGLQAKWEMEQYLAEDQSYQKVHWLGMSLEKEYGS
uniref:Uncharacterized protein n=1 Tax=Arundo donax TaxID=35708 RepID=A0A0A9V333_ARUDO